MKRLVMQPPVWAPTGHLQTILGYLIPNAQTEQDFMKSVVNAGKKIFSFNNEDQVEYVHRDFGSKHVFVFLHGLAGTYFSNYMRRAAFDCQNHQRTYYLFNHRGAGEIQAKNIYHSGVAPDASEIIAFVRKSHPGKKIVAVGYSMSANILLLLNGKFPHLEQADHYFSINAPIDLQECAILLGQGLNRLYDQRFVRDLREKLPEEDRKKTVGISVHQFDQMQTAPRGGFTNREAYYEQCSAKFWTGDLKQPHIVLMSQDDPFIPFHVYENAQWSPQAVVEITAHGGHLGYLSRNKDEHYGRRWLDVYLSQKFTELQM